MNEETSEFQKNVADSQSALQYAVISEEEKKKLRADLSGYLDECRGRRGSDGETLVYVPPNFDEVADSMNRGDLTTTSEAPWSKYLLSARGGSAGSGAAISESAASFETALDPDGRYSGLEEEVDEADAKLQAGMAKIHLLDNMLSSVHKKDLQIKHDMMSRVQRSDDDDLDSEAPSSGRRSARSVLSRYNDNTFLTRARSVKSATGTEYSQQSSPNSAMTSPQLSARSTMDSPRADNASTFDDGEEEGKEDSKKGDRKEKKNMMEMNKKNLKGTRPSLTVDEELRLRSLFDLDENGQEWEAMEGIKNYGFSDEQRERVRELDQQLEAFGHSDRLAEEASKSQSSRIQIQSGSNGEDSTTENTEKSEKIDKANYLAEQRIEREKQEHSQKLDSMLKSLKNGTADLSGLIGQPVEAIRQSLDWDDESGM